MQLPRMTTRRWMVAVAIVAVAVGAEITRRRWASYHQKAAHYADQQARALATAGRVQAALSRHERRVERLTEEAERSTDVAQRADVQQKLEAEDLNIRTLRGMAEHLHRRANFFGDLKDKYRGAARFPWLPVEPDPPPSESYRSHTAGGDMILIDEATGALWPASPIAPPRGRRAGPNG